MSDSTLSMDRSEFVGRAQDLVSVTQAIHESEKALVARIASTELALTIQLNTKQDKVNFLYLLVPVTLLIGTGFISYFQLNEVYKDRHTKEAEEVHQTQIYEEFSRTQILVKDNQAFSNETRAMALAHGVRIASLETRHLIDERVDELLKKAQEGKNLKLPAKKTTRLSP